MHFEDFFDKMTDRANAIVGGYPDILQNDVKLLFIDIATKGKFALVVDVGLSNRIMVVNVRLTDPNEYEGSIRKLLLLSFLDNKLRAFIEKNNNQELIFW